MISSFFVSIHIIEALSFHFVWTNTEVSSHLSSLIKKSDLGIKKEVPLLKKSHAEKVNKIKPVQRNRSSVTTTATKVCWQLNRFL